MVDSLTEEIIQQALDKTMDNNKIQDGELILVRKEHYAMVMDFLRYDFLPSEYISQALDLPWNTGFENLFLSALRQNISLVLLDKKTGDVMGVRLMGISKAEDTITEYQFEDEAMKKLVGFWNLGDAKTRFYEHYGIEHCIHYFGLGVGEKYRKRGLGTLLVDLSLQFVKNLNISPVYIKAEASSLHSMRIFEKSGFEVLSVVNYDEYKRDGVVVIKSTEVNTCMKTYGIVI